MKIVVFVINQRGKSIIDYLIELNNPLIGLYEHDRLFVWYKIFRHTSTLSESLSNAKLTCHWYIVLGLFRMTETFINIRLVINWLFLGQKLNFGGIYKMAYDINFVGFLDAFRTIIGDTVRSLNNDDTSENLIESAISRLYGLWRNLGRILTSYPQCEPLVEDLQRMINCVEEMKRYIIFWYNVQLSHNKPFTLSLHHLNKNYVKEIRKLCYHICRDVVTVYIQSLSYCLQNNW